jgi:sirohydrochlorin cobaltochelatase
MTVAVMICGHGSRDTQAVDEFNRLAGLLRPRFPGYDVDSGFLEFAKPVIRDGLEALKNRGAKRIVMLPGMLFAARHVKNDLPSEANAFAADNPGIEITMARDLGIEPKLLAAAAERIAEAEPDQPEDRSRSLLIVVGRGTNDPDANSNVCKVTRMLMEGMGFGHAEAAFSGVARPLVDEALERGVKMGFGRIIVFPYFLFTGVLVKRIYAWADEAQAKHPGVEILKAGYFNDHPLLIDSFVARVEKVFTGDNAMNCQLCKYREQIIGYEEDVGAPQQGHHHHVRGIGSGHTHEG